jgi:hypothetical protein
LIVANFLFLIKKLFKLNSPRKILRDEK